MNKTFDYNGVLVAPSKPTKVLRTVKKILHIDSADRDSMKYYTNGDVVYYLPRVYENVLSIRLRAATFPTISNAVAHTYGPVGTDRNGPNVPTSDFSNDNNSLSANYFLVEIDGLNKSDETTVGAQRSTYPDSFFAKINTTITQNSSAPTYFINYNDHTEEENIAKYSPPIGKLDRLHIITRLHSQQGRQGFIYWTDVGGDANGSNNRAEASNYSLTFEIEMLDNNFDDFSSFETRVGQIGFSGHGC
jgi:hypothetical protein